MIVIGVGLVLLLAALIWPSKSSAPLRLNFVNMQPSGIQEDDGAEPWLIALRLTNLDTQSIELAGEWITLEAKVANHWADVKHLSRPMNVWSPRLIYPQEHRDILLLLPEGADACRMRLNYQGEMFSELLKAKLSRWVWRMPWVVRAVRKSSTTSKWLWAPNAQPFRRPPTWMQLEMEISLPKNSAKLSRRSPQWQSASLDGPWTGRKVRDREN